MGCNTYASPDKGVLFSGWLSVERIVSGWVDIMRVVTKSYMESRMGIERRQVAITMVSVDTRVGFMTCLLQLRRLASSSSRSPPAYFEGFLGQVPACRLATS